MKFTIKVGPKYGIPTENLHEEITKTWMQINGTLHRRERNG
jgi:hypothetical protein